MNSKSRYVVFLTLVLALVSGFVCGGRLLALAAPAADGVVIGEIRTDQSSSTDPDEYFELVGLPATSLDGYTYLVIGDGTGGSGVIESVVDLSGHSIPSDGVFLAVENTFTLNAAADFTTTLNFENSDNVTHLLVTGFTGSDGDDLDTDNDGVLDVTPWAAVVDLVAIIEENNPPSNTEYHYGPPQVGPDAGFVPSHVYRCPNGWYIGDRDLAVDDTPGSLSSCPPDLVVTNSGPSEALPGEIITYTLRVENLGETATNVMLTDTLPALVNYVDYSSEGAVVTQSSVTPSSSVWELGSIAYGSPVTISLQVEISNTVSGLIINEAEVSTESVEVVLENNISRAYTYVGTGSAEISLNQLGTYSTTIFNGGAAEIAAYDPLSETLFVVNGYTETIDVLDISDPFSPSLNFEISVTPYGASANSVAVHDGIVAVAVEAATATDPGSVVFFDRSGNYLNEVVVGALPDMVTFTPDGSKVLVANEGEAGAINPEGSVSVIDISGGVMSPVNSTLGFTSFTTATNPSIRVSPGVDLANDVEPEYIAVSADSSTAWVTLQENNALAMVNLDTLTVTQLMSLGTKDHSLAGYEFDASDRDDLINIASWPVKGMYQPDAVAAYQVGAQTYLVTANEGNSRGEDERVKNITLDPAFPNASALQDDAALGRLEVSTIDGDIDGDGDFDELYAYGARSFSIWNGATGALVFDSGSLFEEFTAAVYPDNFNADNTDNTFDLRSDSKGVEPEGVTVGEINGRFYAFIGLERIGGVMVFDVTQPDAPSFVQYLNNRDFTKDPQTQLLEAGDLGPEGLLFIPGADSPIDSPLLVIVNEVSGSTTIYEIEVPTNVSLVKEGPSVVEIGESLVYSMSVQAPSTLVKNVVLTDTLPISTTYVSDNSGVIPTNPLPGIYVWNFGDLAADTRLTFHLTATTDMALSTGTVLTNSALVSTSSPSNDPLDDAALVETVAYAIVPIADARAGDPDEVFAIEGYVTYVPGTYNAAGWALQDASAGISAYYFPAPSVALGDFVRLVATRGAYNNEEQMAVPVYFFENLSSGPEVEPRPFVSGDISTGSTEGWLSVITGTISGLSSCSGNYSFQVDNVSGSADIHVDEDTSVDLCAMGFADGDGVKVTGFSTQFGSTYQIKPRRASDVVEVEVISGIVINEIMKDPSAVDDSQGEWIELYNDSAAAVDLDGCVLKDQGADMLVIDNGGPLMIAQDAYLVLGVNDTVGANGGVAVSYAYSRAMFTLDNEDDEILLFCNDIEVDRVVFDGGPQFPDPEGASLQLEDLTKDNNQGANWCTAYTLWPGSAGDFGTPGMLNVCPAAPDLATSIKTSTAPNALVNLGDIITYTITLSNTGDLQSSVLITDNLAAYYTLVDPLDFVTATASSLTWSGVLSADLSLDLQFVVRVNTNFAFPNGSTVLSNTAQINDGVVAPFDIEDAAPPHVEVRAIYLPAILKVSN